MLALTNILGNAVKHAPDGSTIAIRGWEQDDKIHVAVRDQGPGFAPEEADRLFEKYYRSVRSATARSRAAASASTLSRPCRAPRR